LRLRDIGIFLGIAPNESNWGILRFSDIGIYSGVATNEITKSRNIEISNEKAIGGF
jgi:hypothetical protein